MTTPVNIVPEAPVDGVVYADDVPITSTEATLGDAQQVPVLIPTTFGAAVIAVVRLSINGYITGNSTYVVLQMDLGDGVWVDLNWLVWTAAQGTATFVFSNGVAGANTVQQTRDEGAVPTPQASGSNQMVLAGRLRFVGKSTIISGSAVPGESIEVSATVTYKLLPLR